MNVPIEIIVLVVGGFLSMLSFGFGIIWQNTKAINSINITLSKFDQKMEDERDKHFIIDKSLTEHEAKINAHGMLLREHDIKIKAFEK